MGYMKRLDAKQQRLARAVANTTVKTTMQRRKFVIGLGALSTGTAAAVGTGAFTSVTADRDVEVAVAEDADAFLRLEAVEGSANADAFVEEEDGTIAIDITETEQSGEDGGLNPNAETVIDDLFVIQNRGTQEIEVKIDEEFEPIKANVLEVEGSESADTDDLLSGSQTLSVGDEATIGLVLDTEGFDQDDELDADFTIVAEAVDD